MQSDIPTNLSSLTSADERFRNMSSLRNGDQLVDEVIINGSIIYNDRNFADIAYNEHFNVWNAMGCINIVTRTKEDARKMKEFIIKNREHVNNDGIFCVVDAASGEVSQVHPDPGVIQFMFLEQYFPQDDLLPWVTKQLEYSYFFKYYIVTPYTPFNPASGMVFDHWFIQIECCFINMVLHEIIARANMNSANVSAENSDFNDRVNDYNDYSSSFVQEHRIAYTGKFGECTMAEITVSDVPGLQISSMKAAFIPATHQSFSSMMCRVVDDDAIIINNQKAYFCCIKYGKPSNDNIDTAMVLPVSMLKKFGDSKPAIFAIDLFKSEDFTTSIREQLVNEYTAGGQQAMHKCAKTLVMDVVKQLNQYI